MPDDIFDDYGGCDDFDDLSFDDYYDEDDDLEDDYYDEYDGYYPDELIDE